MSETVKHVSGVELEQLAEGVISPPGAASLQAHLATCRECAIELDAYRSLVTQLSSLPRFAPSTEFADAVMARVQLVPRESLVARWFHRVIPTTRRGWVLAGTIATAPLTPVLALLGLMLVQPLITPTTLLQWAQIRTQSVSQAALAWMSDQVVGSLLWSWVETAYGVMQTVPSGVFAGAAGVIAIGIPLSAWTLLTLTRPPATRRMTHAN